MEAIQGGHLCVRIMVSKQLLDNFFTLKLMHVN